MCVHRSHKDLSCPAFAKRRNKPFLTNDFLRSMKIFSLLHELSYPSLLRRIIFFLFFDVLIITFSLYLSFLVHFDFNFNIAYSELLRDTLLFFIVIKIASLAAFRVYNLTWR